MSFQPHKKPSYFSPSIKSKRWLEGLLGKSIFNLSSFQKSSLAGNVCLTKGFLQMGNGGDGMWFPNQLCSWSIYGPEFYLFIVSYHKVKSCLEKRSFTHKKRHFRRSGRMPNNIPRETTNTRRRWCIVHKGDIQRNNVLRSLVINLSFNFYNENFY